MKKIPILMLSLLTMPTYAQSILSTLTQHQNSLQSPESPRTGGQGGSSAIGSRQEVSPSQSSTSSSTIKCESNDQTSLPLAYITSLIQEKDAKLNLSHDNRTGKITIESGDMIGNCSSMLEWNLDQPVIEGRKAYAIQVKFKNGENCTADGCTYKVAKVENGDFKSFEPMVLKPTLKGFEECLQKSGVVSAGKVVPGAIYNSPVKEKFDGLNESRKLFFVSNGPASAQVKSKYGANGKFEYVHGCDHYEPAHPSIRSLLTYDDAEKERLDAEAARLRDCKVDEYGKLAEFIDKYESYQSELGEVRDRLILEAVKKSAAAIESGKYTDDDLKVIQDFERYLVTPRVERARALYEEILDLEGDAKKVKQDELVKLLAEISALGKKPYFLSSHTLKLVNDGKFDEAEKLNNLKLMIDHHQRLGAKQDNVIISTGVASQRMAADRASFAQLLVKEKEKYEYRTGQVSGKAQLNANYARRMRQNIQARTTNFNNEIMLEYQRMQPGGYCYKYWRNTQKCIQDSMERIQELQALMNHYNSIDEQRAADYEAIAKEYSDLEAQGRRYIAAQNGQEVSAEAPVTTQPEVQDTTVPTSRPQVQDAGTYSFQYPGNQGHMNPQQMYQQQGQMMPPQHNPYMNPHQNNNMFMQQQSPYGYYQQQPYMGQQSFGMPNQYGFNQGAYNFAWGGGGHQQQPNPYGYQMQQSMPYYNSPYQAYGNYNFNFGRR